MTAISPFTKLLATIDSIRPWLRGGQRAPHKPLLFLFAIGRFIAGKSEWISFSDTELPVRRLLIDFGPPRINYHPEYPFWRLARNEGLWELKNDHLVRARKGNADPPVSELRRHNVCGRLPPWVQEVLDEAPDRPATVARYVLDHHFPNSLHEDIAERVGIILAINNVGSTPRDPAFREDVLRAYRHRCAVCGYDVRFAYGTVVGLEAAHIRMRTCNGPDEARNGIALCALHHKLFDYGAFTLDEHFNVVASDEVTGSDALDDLILKYDGRQIRVPDNGIDRPLSEHIVWHNKQVFKGRVRRSLPV